MNEKQEFIVGIYERAKARGLVHNQKEFAEALDLNPSTISSAMNGLEKALTDRLVARIQRWAASVDLEGGKPQAPKDERPDIVIPAATMDLYTSMAKSIDRLTALVEMLQPGASAFGAMQGYAPHKNPRLDK